MPVPAMAASAGALAKQSAIVVMVIGHLLPGGSVRDGRGDVGDMIADDGA